MVFCDIYFSKGNKKFRNFDFLIKFCLIQVVFESHKPIIKMKVLFHGNRTKKVFVKKLLLQIHKRSLFFEKNLIFFKLEFLLFEFQSLIRIKYIFWSPFLLILKQIILLNLILMREDLIFDFIEKKIILLIFRYTFDTVINSMRFDFCLNF